MRPDEGAAVLLLVAAMFMSDSAAAPTTNLDDLCQNPAQCEGMDGEGWFGLGDGRCVKAFHETPLNFKDAENACKQHTSRNNFSAQLVSIHSQEEVDQVVCAMHSVTPGRPPYWIGLYLSLYVESHLIYDWTDGTQFLFSYFASYQPNYYNEEEECVETNYYYWGRWNDVNCNFLRPYVCAVKV